MSTTSDGIRFAIGALVVIIVFFAWTVLAFYAGVVHSNNKWVDALGGEKTQMQIEPI